MSSTPNTPIEELEQIFTNVFSNNTYVLTDLPEITELKSALMAWRERAVTEARQDENMACQKIVRSKWGTNDQIWDMEARLTTPTKEREESMTEEHHPQCKTNCNKRHHICKDTCKDPCPHQYEEEL